MSSFFEYLKLGEIVAAPEVDQLSEASSGSSWKMEEMSATDPQNPAEVSAVDSDDPVSLFRVLLEEYRQLLAHLPVGMVVAPAFHTLLEWHGSIHIKDGYYKGAIFKFVINIPVDYPASAPGVYFFNAVFHPLVDPVTGKLDLSIAFPTWKSGRDYIVLVLAFVKKIFFKRELNSFLISMPRADFENRCKECVTESLKLAYVCHPNSPIPFSPIGQPVKDLVSCNSGGSVEIIEKKLAEIRANFAAESQFSEFEKWILGTYIPQLRIDN